MRTGEGKTLVATLPSYLNALTGKGVHVVTVNDYLAKRDAEWMGRIHGFLGLTTGVIVHGLDDFERQAQLQLRHHVRPEQRVRLRLPARQHEDVAGPHGPARPQLRDRRRGRLDPDRRGAHAAHHLGLGRESRRPLRQDRPHDPAPQARGRLHRRREGALARCSPTTASRRWRSCSRSTTCTRRRTSSSSTTSTRRCARTRCTSATSTTSSRRARSSSSTSTPAARCRAGAGAMVSTRRSRPRKASPSRKRTRRSRRSRSRTTSACTRSCRA